MKRKTINSEMREQWQRIAAYLDSSPPVQDLRQARLASLPATAGGALRLSK